MLVIKSISNVDSRLAFSANLSSSVLSVSHLSKYVSKMKCKFVDLSEETRPCFVVLGHFRTVAAFPFLSTPFYTYIPPTCSSLEYFGSSLFMLYEELYRNDKALYDKDGSFIHMDIEEETALLLKCDEPPDGPHS